MKAIKVKTGCRDCPFWHYQGDYSYSLCTALKTTIPDSVLDSNSNEWLSLDNCPLIKQGVVNVIPCKNKFSQPRADKKKMPKYEDDECAYLIYHRGAK